MKQVLMLALALVSIPAFASWDHHPSRHWHHHDRGWDYSDSDRAIGPVRGAYNLNGRGASCEGARAAVNSHGSVNVYYGDGLFTRVVRDGSFCSHDQYTEPFWANGCFVGYTCRQNSGY